MYVDDVSQFINEYEHWLGNTKVYIKYTTVKQWDMG